MKFWKISWECTNGPCRPQSPVVLWLVHMHQQLCWYSCRSYTCSSVLYGWPPSDFFGISLATTVKCHESAKTVLNRKYNFPIRELKYWVIERGTTINTALHAGMHSSAVQLHTQLYFTTHYTRVTSSSTDHSVMLVNEHSCSVKSSRRRARGKMPFHEAAACAHQTSTSPVLFHLTYRARQRGGKKPTEQPLHCVIRETMCMHSNHAKWYEHCRQTYKFIEVLYKWNLIIAFCIKLRVANFVLCASSLPSRTLPLHCLPRVVIFIQALLQFETCW